MIFQNPAINTIALAMSAAVAAPTSALADAIKLEFGTFVDFGMVEQDVYITNADGKVRRIPAAEVEDSMDVSIFGSKEAAPFQPMNLTPTATYEKGIDLGMTLSEWLGATGTGTVTCENGKALVDIDLSGLVPNAVYTMWNFIDAEPPTDPWQGILYPLGARDGSDATFNTDSDGNARYQATFEPCLQVSGTQTMAGIAAAWHPDKKTHGSSPGTLGVDSFAQLMTALIE